MNLTAQEWEAYNVNPPQYVFKFNVPKMFGIAPEAHIKYDPDFSNYGWRIIIPMSYAHSIGDALIKYNGLDKVYVIRHIGDETGHLDLRTMQVFQTKEEALDALATFVKQEGGTLFFRE